MGLETEADSEDEESHYKPTEPIPDAQLLNDLKLLECFYIDPYTQNTSYF